MVIPYDTNRFFDGVLYQREAPETKMCLVKYMFLHKYAFFLHNLSPNKLYTNKFAAPPRKGWRDVQETIEYGNYMPCNL